MKVVKRGKAPDEVSYRGNCPNCRSVLEAGSRELEVMYDVRESGYFGKAPCVVCGANVTFYPKERRR